jgi:serine/threonine protein phosphatase 1
MRWIIGDIHGMLRPLEALLSAIARQDAHAQLFFTGDYVNRGPASCGVIDRLLSLRGARFIRGNHDDIFQLILTGQCFADNDATNDPSLAVRWFLEFGLAETLTSYGIDAPELREIRRDPAAGLARIRNAVPDRHKAFIQNLPPVIEQDDFFIAHAYWYPNDLTPEAPLPPRLTTNARARRDVVWTRFAERQITDDKTWSRTGYFGHTPTPFYHNLLLQPFHPIRGPHVTLVDTAAATDPRGRLTAFCHETEKFIQADREGAIVYQGG